MLPSIQQRRFVEARDYGLNIVELEQARAARNQQTQRKLDGRDVFHQTQFREQFEQLAMRLARGPWRERDERGRERQSHVAKLSGNRDKVRASVPLVQLFQDRVIHRLYRASHEKASGLFQARQQAAMLAEVFDL